MLLVSIGPLLNLEAHFLYKGSSTVVLAVLDSNSTLRTLNLGDSGFRIVRDGKILYASKGTLRREGLHRN
jgi:hypothetical protein